MPNLGPDLGDTRQSVNGKLIELSVMIEDQIEFLVHMHDNLPRWRWLRRRDLKIMINCLGIVSDLINTAGHTYVLEV